MATLAPKKQLAELAAIASDLRALEGARGRQQLLGALASKHVQLSVQAAKLIAEHQLAGFEPALSAAYRSFCGDRATTIDPGGHAKEALLAALDATDSADAELFAAAALYVQLERGSQKSAQRDTAGGVRARGVLGLARLGHPDLWPILGTCLVDRDPVVRLSAARAVAHREQREGAGLLLMRLGMGDDTAEVLVECIRGLFVIAPEFAVRRAQQALADPDPDTRARMLQALGTAPKDAAATLLVDELDKHSLASERQPIIEALGLSLRPLARDCLLALVASERASDAEAALSALAIHRYDARLVAQVKERVSGSRELARRFRELFPE